MLDQRAVDQWLDRFVAKLKDTFGNRLVYVGHHGSWARGEGEAGSDIDTIVILDQVESKDLTTFRDLISSMPNAKSLASGFLLSVAEHRVWPRFDGVQFFYECRALYRRPEDIVKKPTPADLLEDIRVKASSNLLVARHYLLYPHGLMKIVHKLHYPFKCCFFGLQSWVLLREGRFIARKEDLLNVLSDPDDQEVTIVGRDWRKSHQDREKRPSYYIELLERWSRKMLLRVQAYEATKRNENGRT